MMAERTIKYRMSRYDYFDVIEMARYGVIIWCEEMSWTRTSGGCWFTDYKGKKFWITKTKMEEALLGLLEDAETYKDWYKVIGEIVFKADWRDFDADVANQIIQKACYGEVIYG